MHDDRPYHTSLWILRQVCSLAMTQLHEKYIHFPESSRQESTGTNREHSREMRFCIMRHARLITMRENHFVQRKIEYQFKEIHICRCRYVSLPSEHPHVNVVYVSVKNSGFNSGCVEFEFLSRTHTHARAVLLFNPSDRLTPQ